MKYKVAIVMGSDSDLPKVQPAINRLKEFDIPMEVHVMSAHRSPKLACSFAEEARDKGFGVIIAAAGKAAHLGGVLAAHTTLPVIGIPIGASMEGLDALLSTVQMPPGVPVATVGVDASDNAAILAVQILSVSDPSLADKLDALKDAQLRGVVEKDKKLQQDLMK